MTVSCNFVESVLQSMVITWKKHKNNFIVFLFFQTESQNFDSVHTLLTFAHIITHCPF